ncbi:polyglutamine-binding protein 1 [Trichonephila inaurata madagascariensis]|uniref:Polyglutamine-binding protein 1 n=1 Tax=Trichonephila inaurata madagascariensis TaxID=2747483 RepID=A0A8X6YM24_9ARAC|nr:polyglutamine-binding protein 1 [Trichonephila inaurata madagascariensis]
MPLPAALLARLQKRGIVKAVEPEVEEEVIAEDYDDTEKTTDNHQNGIESKENSPLNEPWIGCPNKWNIYHDCTVFCKEFWGSGRDHPSPRTDRRRLLMLKKYPVPNGWEVYMPKVGRHYYWNTQTNEVAWLPPGHPRCTMSHPADKLRALIKETFLDPMDEGDDDDQNMSESEEDSEDEENEPINKDKERNDRHHKKDHVRDRSRGRPKMRENDLDPMDPASYSEAPREAKTGRKRFGPFPNFISSPGAVLRLNAEIKNKAPSDSEDL